METGSTPVVIYPLEDHRTDRSISSLTGLSIGVVTAIFTLTIGAIKLAGIHFSEWIQGDFHLHGDLSLLYMAIFVISATMLLLIQHHFSVYEEEEDASEVRDPSK